MIARLRHLLSEATPGPWRPEREPPPIRNDYFDRHMRDDSSPIESTGTAFAFGTAVGVTSQRQDAQLIAAAVNALPKLLAVVDAARKLAYAWRHVGADELVVAHEAEEKALVDALASLEG
jgi:hypothetical protein